MSAPPPRRPLRRAPPAGRPARPGAGRSCERWEADKVFARTLEGSAGRPQWVFYEGPPTANGRPGTHHIEARAFKDVFPRFKTMQGWHVPRRAGWDCHGLPVEIAVEQELGFAGKPDIERYGIAEFNARCRESVERHVDSFAELTRRMGYWVDMSTAYWTMDPAYIESVWWSLKQIFDKGLLVEDHRVAPVLPPLRHGPVRPRGRPGLRDPDRPVGLRAAAGHQRRVGRQGRPARSGRRRRGRCRRTPPSPCTPTSPTWSRARRATGTFVVAEPLLAAVLGARTPRSWPAPPAGTGSGSPTSGRSSWSSSPDDTTRTTSSSPTTSPPRTAPGWCTSPPRSAPTTSPSAAATACRWSTRSTRPATSCADVPLVGGHFFKAADPAAGRGPASTAASCSGSSATSTAIRTAGAATRRSCTTRSRPGTSARSAIKDQLLAENEKTNWYPENIKTGRYGDWLNNNVDWALSRDRYWGTPLPIWRNDADPTRLVAVGSLAELSELTGRDLSDLDPHRPFIDDVTFTLPGEEGTFRRVRQVIDAWYDSGSMPFAQWGAPHRNKAEFEAVLPGAVHLRGDRPDPRLVLHADGGRHAGVREELLRERAVPGPHPRRGRPQDEQAPGQHPRADPADGPARRRRRPLVHAGRRLAVVGPPGRATRRCPRSSARCCSTYWNTASFFTLYAEANGWDPAASPAPARAERPLLDRWALAELAAVTDGVTAALEDFDTQGAGRLLAEFVDDLSNWYVRRSRRRFWDGDPAALATLHEVLDGLTRLMAPFTPFVTEEVWARAVAPGPGADAAGLGAPRRPGRRSTRPPATTSWSRRWRWSAGWSSSAARPGRRPRCAPGSRWPRAVVAAPGWAHAPPRPGRRGGRRAQRGRAGRAVGGRGELVDVSVKIDFRAVGRRLGKQVQAVAKAVAAADAAELTAAYRAGTATVEVDGAAGAAGGGRPDRHRDPARGLDRRQRQRPDASRWT